MPNLATTRRKLLTTTAVAGTAALAGCGGGGSGGGSSGGDGTSNVIIGSEVVRANQDVVGPYNLAVDLTEDHGLSRLTIQNPDGSVRSETEVNSAQTRVELSIYDATGGADITDESYEIIGYDGETVVERSQWTPERSVEIVGFPLDDDRTVRNLNVELENTGNVPVEAVEGYVSAGYPIPEGEDRVGEIVSETTILPAQTNDVSIISGGLDGHLLSPPDGACDGTEELTATVVTRGAGEISKAVSLEFGGESRYMYSGDACTDVTVSGMADP